MCDESWAKKYTAASGSGTNSADQPTCLCSSARLLSLKIVKVEETLAPKMKHTLLTASRQMYNPQMTNQRGCGFRLGHDGCRPAMEDLNSMGPHENHGGFGPQGGQMQSWNAA
jgi:hypothetical protein